MMPSQWVSGPRSNFGALADGSTGSLSVAFGAQPSTGFYRSNGSRIVFVANGTDSVSVGANRLFMTAATIAGWTTSTDVAVGSFDTAFARTSAGVVEVNNGTMGTLAAIRANNFWTSAPNTQVGATYTVAASDSALIINAAGTCTLTLPAAASFTGRTIRVKTIAAQTVVSNASNVVPLVGGAAGTAILAATAGKWADLTSDGTNWIVMAGA